MKWEEGDIYQSLRAAIVAAKDPKKDILRDPAIVGPLARLTEISNHGYFNRHGSVNNSIKGVHGWKKIAEVHRKDGLLTNLDMELWQKGNATVASVLSVKSPFEREGNDIATAVAQLSEWQKQYPNLVAVGHGDKGSKAVLEAAMSAQRNGKPVLPTLALEPELPGPGFRIAQTSPVVGVNLTANTWLNGLFSKTTTGLVTRRIDGSNVAGTGQAVASNWMNAIDARSYYAAMGIAAVNATGDKDIGPVIAPPTQPWIVRAFNPSWDAKDPRLELIETEKNGTSKHSFNGEHGMEKIRYVAYDVNALSTTPEAEAKAGATVTAEMAARHQMPRTLRTSKMDTKF